MSNEAVQLKRFLNSQVELLSRNRFIRKSSPNAEKLDRLDRLSIDFSLDNDFESVFVFRLLSSCMR